MKTLVKYTWVTCLLLLASNVVVAQADLCDQLDRSTREINIQNDNPRKPYPPLPPVLPPPPPEDPKAKTRGVIWTHGIGGNDYSMTKAIQLSTNWIPHTDQTPGQPLEYVNNTAQFPPRHMETETPSYAAGQDLFTAGFRVGEAIRRFSKVDLKQTVAEAKEENYCISHSMGGLCVRYAEIIGAANGSSGDDGFRAGGMVTLATPHAGAILAQNIYRRDNPNIPIEFDEFENDAGLFRSRATDKFKNFLNLAASALVDGPKEDAIHNNFLLNLLEDKVRATVDVLISEITAIAPAIASGSFFSRSVLNLMPVDPQLQVVYNSSNATVNVPFYGVEDKDLTLWKLAYWGVNNPNNVPEALKTPDGDGFFDAGNDELAEKMYRDLLMDYNAKLAAAKVDWVNYNLDVGKNCPTNVFQCIKAINNRKKALDRINAWNNGIRWIQSSSARWDLLTGARTYEIRNVCRCDDFTITIPGDCPVINGVQCINDGIINIEIYKQNCGVVLAESAEDFNGSVFKKFNGTPTGLPLAGSNHFQMRNDQSLKGALLKLYNASYPELEFFKTEAKQM